jgi:hypothetical protein
MRKNPLASALAAAAVGVVGVANISNAVTLNPDGVGQVLVYPYYSANGGNDTLISVVNTTANSKAVKVRFLEALNSREVLDFNLYLSEYDVWAAAVTRGSDLTSTGGLNYADRAILVVATPADPSNSPLIDDSEDTCTVPPTSKNTLLTINPTFADGRVFVPFREQAAFGDPGPDNLDRLNEGYVEMIEMATIVDGSYVDSLVTHRFGGEPNGCDNLEDGWLTGTSGGTTGDRGLFANPGADPNDPALGFAPPSGGLFGGGAIINVRDGAFYNYNADALEAFSGVADHTPPGSIEPNLSDVNDGPGTGTATSRVFINGQTVVSVWGAGQATGDTVLNGRIDAVSHVFALDHLYNEYTTERALNAASEWVLTFPTKAFYVDGQRYAPAPKAPFTRSFGSTGACEPVNIRIYDREEDFIQVVDFSPPNPEGRVFCWESQVLSFNQAPGASSVLGSNFKANINTRVTRNGIDQQVFEKGWVDIDFGTASSDPQFPAPGHQSRLSNDLDQYFGLPVTGFWAIRVENAFADPIAGGAGNYGGLNKHRGSRRCEGQQAVNPSCLN